MNLHGHSDTLNFFAIPVLVYISLFSGTRAHFACNGYGEKRAYLRVGTSTGTVLVLVQTMSPLFPGIRALEHLFSV